jgi:hypothetical protein
MIIFNYPSKKELKTRVGERLDYIEPVYSVRNIGGMAY